MMVWSTKPKGNSSTGNMVKCVVVPSAGFRQEIIYQGGSCIILLVNALHMHFCSSAWQHPLYFMAGSNKNCPCAVGFGLKDSKPSELVPLLLPRHQCVISREMYPCKYFTRVSNAQLTEKTVPMPGTVRNGSAHNQMTVYHAGQAGLFLLFFFLSCVTTYLTNLGKFSFIRHCIWVQLFFLPLPDSWYGGLLVPVWGARELCSSVKIRLYRN